jgi:hypothetical protein
VLPAKATDRRDVLRIRPPVVTEFHAAGRGELGARPFNREYTVLMITGFAEQTSPRRRADRGCRDSQW